jgi:hypothetical protein
MTSKKVGVRSTALPPTIGDGWDKPAESTFWKRIDEEDN